jgi:hypothetical protein
MNTKLINKLKLDIENAEKFFNRTGEDIKEAYICENPEVEKVDESGLKNIFLYIPESYNDIYVLSLN